MIKIILLCLLCSRSPAAAQTVSTDTVGAPPPAAQAAPTVNAQAAALLGQGKPQEAYDLLQPPHAADKSDVETAFLLGQAAMQIKRPAEAAELYEGIISKNNDLPRVRLELARAYAALGEVKKAKEQFLAVLGDSPPPMVGENIGKYMASMETQKNWNARAGIGYIYDSNVNAGPTAGSVLMFGVPFRLSDDARETGAGGYTAGLGGGYLRKMKNDLAFQADAQYSRTGYWRRHAFDSDVLSGSAGLTLQKKTFILSAPLLFERVWIARRQYDYAFGVSPQVMVPISERVVTNASAVLQKKHYYVNDGLRNGTVWSATAGAKYYYRENGFLQASFRHGKEKTGAGYLDNSSNGLNLGWYTSLPEGLTLYFGPGISFTAYKETEAAYDSRRKDTQYSSVINLSREFPAAGLSATVGYTFTRNDSNLSLYDYCRSQYTMQLSKAF